MNLRGRVLEGSWHATAVHKQTIQVAKVYQKLLRPSQCLSLLTLVHSLLLFDKIHYHHYLRNRGAIASTKAMAISICQTMAVRIVRGHVGQRRMDLCHLSKPRQWRISHCHHQIVVSLHSLKSWQSAFVEAMAVSIRRGFVSRWRMNLWHLSKP